MTIACAQETYETYPHDKTAYIQKTVAITEWTQAIVDGDQYNLLCVHKILWPNEKWICRAAGKSTSVKIYHNGQGIPLGLNRSVDVQVETILVPKHRPSFEEVALLQAIGMGHAGIQ